MKTNAPIQKTYTFTEKFRLAFYQNKLSVCFLSYTKLMKCHQNVNDNVYTKFSPSKNILKCYKYYWLSKVLYNLP